MHHSKLLIRSDQSKHPKPSPLTVIFQVKVAHQLGELLDRQSLDVPRLRLFALAESDVAIPLGVRDERRPTRWTVGCTSMMLEEVPCDRTVGG